jgi:DNA end-binding protein Ku
VLEGEIAHVNMKLVRAIWAGTISFGLVSVPVRLYPVVRKLDVRFREIDRRTGARIRHQRVAEIAPEPPPDEAPAAEPAPTAAAARPAPPARSSRQEEEIELVKGFEVGPGRYVQVESEELRALEPERTKTIDVEQFVELKDLDPLYFDASYHVVPDRDLDRPFALLAGAMRAEVKAAVGWIVLRRRRHLAALRPRGELMLLTTLHFADELVSPPAREPVLEEALTAREKQMAELLVRTLSGPFEPERYRDEYRERVLALIEGRQPVEAEQPEPAADVANLMAALEASLKAARSRGRRRSA